MSKPVRLVILVLAIVAIGAAISWSLGRRHRASELVLYGNVDLRQVDLPFNGSERIADVLVQEGDHVKHGQLLARLETSRLGAAGRPRRRPMSLRSSKRWIRLHHGNRPEEIAQARANVAGRGGRRRQRRAHNMQRLRDAVRELRRAARSAARTWMRRQGRRSIPPRRGCS